MYFDELELINFGGHKHLKVQLGGTTCGFLGPNGAGKSTILAAFKFLLTGELDDKQETYIYADINGEIGNAEARGKFRKNNVRGEIYRRIGKSPKKELKWGDDKPLTKSRDIDAKMREIFSADKVAMEQAIFIPQGSFDKLLFGDQPEREQLFMRLLLLGHFPTVENAIDGQISKLSSTVEDFGPLKDQLESQMRDMAERKVTLQGNLDQYKDRAQELSVLNSIKVMRDNLVQWNSDNATITQTVENAQQTLRQLLGQAAIALDRSLFSSHEEFVMNLSFIASETQRYEREYHDTKGQLEKIAQVKNLQESINKTLEAKATGEKWLAQQNELLAQYPESLEEHARVLTARQELKGKIDQSWKDIQAARTEVLSLEGKPPTAEHAALKDKSELETSERLRLQQLKQYIQLLEMAISHPHSDQDCPLCQGKVDGALMSPEALAKAKAEAQTLEERVKMIHGEVELIRRTIATYDRDLATARATLANYERSGAQLEAEWKQQDLEKYPDADIGELKTRAEARRALVAGINKGNERMAQILGNLESYRQQMPSDAVALLQLDAEALLAQQNKAQAEWMALTNKRRLIDPMLEGINHWQNTIIRNMGALDNTTKLITSTETKKEEAWVEFHRISLEPPEDIAGKKIEAMLERIQQSETQRVALRAQIAEINQQEIQLRFRLDEVTEKMRRQDAVMTVIDELKILKKTFNRHGLARQYMDYRFAQLTDMTQKYLADLGSNFVIGPDPETPLSYLFTRLDKPDVAALPMFKLSGGQRVRLTIAFLLAVHQIVIPEIGLLVLDEPSVHVDVEGVEYLCDLLTNLSKYLANTETQVILCDHSIPLERALGVAIRLHAQPDNLPAEGAIAA